MLLPMQQFYFPKTMKLIFSIVVMCLYLYSVCLICRVSSNTFKGNAQFIFLCNLQKSLLNFCLIMILKSTVTKKVIMGFNNLGEENFLTSIIVLFEIHQRFKGHFLNELCISFKWLLRSIAYVIQKIILRNLTYVQCLNIAPIEKA